MIDWAATTNSIVIASLAGEVSSSAPWTLLLYFKIGTGDNPTVTTTDLDIFRVGSTGQANAVNFRLRSNGNADVRIDAGGAGALTGTAARTFVEGEWCMFAITFDGVNTYNSWIVSESETREAILSAQTSTASYSAIRLTLGQWANSCGANSTHGGICIHNVEITAADFDAIWAVKRLAELIESTSGNLDGVNTLTFAVGLGMMAEPNGSGATQGLPGDTVTGTNLCMYRTGAFDFRNIYSADVTVTGSPTYASPADESFFLFPAISVAGTSSADLPIAAICPIARRIALNALTGPTLVALAGQSHVVKNDPHTISSYVYDQSLVGGLIKSLRDGSGARYIGGWGFDRPDLIKSSGPFYWSADATKTGTIDDVGGSTAFDDFGRLGLGRATGGGASYGTAKARRLHSTATELYTADLPNRCALVKGSEGAVVGCLLLGCPGGSEATVQAAHASAPNDATPTLVGSSQVIDLDTTRSTGTVASYVSGTRTITLNESGLDIQVGDLAYISAGTGAGSLGMVTSVPTDTTVVVEAVYNGSSKVGFATDPDATSTIKFGPWAWHKVTFTLSAATVNVSDDYWGVKVTNSGSEDNCLVYGWLSMVNVPGVAVAAAGATSRGYASQYDTTASTISAFTTARASDGLTQLQGWFKAMNPDLVCLTLAPTNSAPADLGGFTNMLRGAMNSRKIAWILSPPCGVNNPTTFAIDAEWTPGDANCWSDWAASNQSAHNVLATRSIDVAGFGDSLDGYTLGHKADNTHHFTAIIGKIMWDSILAEWGAEARSRTVAVMSMIGLGVR